MALADLIVKVGADIAGFHGAMGDVSKELSKVVRDADKAVVGFEKLGDSAKSLGKQLTLAITVPLAGIGIAALKTAGDFEQSMAKITAFGDIGGQALEGLRSQALELGKQTQFSAQQAADAMVVFASAGQNAEQIYAAMPGTLSLAAAGQLGVAEAATITKDVLGQFQLEAAQSGHVADVLAQASADASSSLSEMATTLTYAGPIAKGAGQSIEETVAAIVALDAAGIRGEKAGTGLRGVLGSLLAPSKEAAAFIHDLGVKIADTNGKILPLSDIMEQFRTKLQGVGTEAEKQRIIFEVFGREAGNAAQVLINTGGKALDEMQVKLVNSTGAAEKMAKTINSGLNFSLEQLKGSVETAGIALGTALIPLAKQGLTVVTDLVNAVIPLIEWFSKLPTPIQNAAIGMVGLVAAAGPVIYVSGQMISSFATLNSAITSMVGGLGALKGGFAATEQSILGTVARLGPMGGQVAELVRGLGLFQTGLIAVAGAVTALQLKDLILEIKELVDLIAPTAIKAFNDLTSSLLASGKAAILAAADFLHVRELLLKLLPDIKGLDKAWNVLSGTLERGSGIKALALNLGLMAEAVSHLGEAYKTLMRYFPDMSDEVAKAATVHGAAGIAAMEHAKQLKETTEAVKSIKLQQSEATKELEKAQRVYSEYVKLHKQGAASSDDVARALRAVQEAAARAHPELDTMGGAAERLSKMAKLSAGDIKILENNTKAATERWKAWAQASYDLDDALKMIPPDIDAIKSMHDALEESIKRNTEAEREFLATLGDMEAAASAVMRKLISDSTLVSEALQGIDQTGGAAERRIDTIAGTAAAAGRAMQEAQQKMENFRKSLASMLTMKIAGGLTDIIFGGDRRAFNDNLEKQSEDLRKSLGERTEDWLQYQADLAQQLVDLRATIAADLAEQENDLRASLAERTAEYEAYVAGVPAAEAAIREKNAAGLEEEVADLREKLAEKQQAYQQYAEEVAEKIVDIRAKHAEQLAGQLADLAESLADQTEKYADFVADTNAKLANLGVENADSIKDEAVKTKRGIEDKKKAYKREEEDILAKIAKLEKENKASNREQIEDLKKSLARKQQDLDEYVREAEEDLQDYTEDHNRHLKQQEEDIKRSLDVRAREFQQYVADNAAKVKTVTEKHRLEEAQQIKDLQDSLAKKRAELDAFDAATQAKIGAVTEAAALELAKDLANLRAQHEQKKAEYDAYQADILAKIEKARNEAALKLAEGEKDLTRSLDRQKESYEKYKADILSKLDEIQDKHRSIWDDLATLATSTLSSIGKTVLDTLTATLLTPFINKITSVLTEHLIKPLTDWIGKALDSILGGITGSGGGVGGAIGGAGNAGGSAAGAAAGGLFGLINMITGVVSAVSDVITAIYAIRQEGTLNAIEQHTKVMAISMAGISEPWGKVEEGFVTQMSIALDSRSWLEKIYSSLVQTIHPDLVTIREAFKLGGTGATPDAGVNASAVFVSVAALIESYSKGIVLAVDTSRDRLRDVLIDVKNTITYAVYDVVAQLRESLEPTLLEKIFSGGILGGGINLGGAGGIGGAISGGIAGGIAAAVGGAKESTLNAVEHNTRYAMMYLGEHGEGSIMQQMFRLNNELAFGTSNKAILETRDWTVNVIGPMLQRIAGELDYIQPTLDSWHDSIISLPGKLDQMISAGSLMAAPAAAPLMPGSPAPMFKIYLDGRELVASWVQYLEETGTKT